SPGDTLKVFRGGKFNRSLMQRASILMNETAVQALNLSAPVGMELNYGRSLQGTVIGVVKDIHNLSLHSRINPMVIRYTDNGGLLVLAYQPGREAEVLQFMRQAWEKLGLKSAFTYFFLNDHLRQLYVADEKFVQMTLWFAALAIMLSCLGLFGLAVFSTEQRTKEIGVRKVLGASVAGIVRLLSSEVTRLVLVANLVAWPIAYFAINRWLQNFAYRIDINWWVFALSGGLALLIALLTESTQAIKAALANPVDSLRYE
ncbi:MAG: ABC transporter permease, partial [bacterium]